MQSITPKELSSALRENKGVLVDVRESFEFKASSVPGARNIPLGEIAEAAARLAGFSAVYVMCRSGSRSTQAYALLAERGVAAVDVEGGFMAWQEARLPVRASRGGSPMPIIRQVMLVAGVLVIAGTAAGILGHPYFFAVPAVVGIGLSFSGLTGHCLMATMLGWMPWNRV